MNVLLLGGGGREHALAWALRRSPEVDALVGLPGSDGMMPLLTARAEGDPCVPGDVLAAVQRHAIDLTVIGPEAPLAAGVADALRDQGRCVFGPSRAAARLESSKGFAKRFMHSHGIPTARFAEADALAPALRALDSFAAPYVIKADGLAAGKGVVVTAERREAERVLESMLAGALVGEAGRSVVIEEFLTGPEVSLLAVADGERAIALVPARDHKRIHDGDRGPNTGGMGAISFDALLTSAELEAVERTVLRPVMRGMAAAGQPFQGVVYCGLMLTSAGPRVLEFNVRFGDPETQALLPRLESSLAAGLLAAARGAAQPEHWRWSPEAAGCVIAAAAGYPGPVAGPQRIDGLDERGQCTTRDTQVFHAGTRYREGAWMTAGGRVLGVAARAAGVEAVRERCYRALTQIHFAGMQFRTDIGGPGATESH